MKKNTKSYQKLFKAALATSVAAGAMVVLAPANSDAATASFPDLKPTSDHYLPVMNLTARGIIKGFPDGTYKPDTSITRGQAAKIIALASNLDTKNVTNPGFKDVAVGNEYYGPIAALVEAGIIEGYTGSDKTKTYRPYEKLTRAQMSKIISLAFGINELPLTDNRFTDVKQDAWFKGYVQGLITNNITKGTTPTTFSPASFVTRGQVASFVVRAEAAKAALDKAQTVTSVTNDSITLSSGTYTIPAELKKVLNATNATALKGAKIKFTAANGVIVKVESIEITAKGTATNNVVLDGAGASIAANVKVSGDYVTLKNLTIKGDLQIGKEVKNSFLASNITVEGKTIISDKAAGAVTTAAVGDGPNIVFTDSKLGTIVVSQTDSTVDFKGTTTVGLVTVTADATINSDATVTIATLTLTCRNSNHTWS